MFENILNLEETTFNISSTFPTKHTFFIYKTIKKIYYYLIMFKSKNFKHYLLKIKYIFIY